MAHLRYTSDARQQLDIVRFLAHPIDVVWNNISDPEHLSIWYPAKISTMPRHVGGSMRIDYGDGYVSEATISQYEPPRLIEFIETALPSMPRETDNIIRIELWQEQAGTKLEFTQTFDDRPAAASYAVGWDSCLDLLDDHLVGADGDHQQPTVDAHNTYIQAFGLDQPIITHDELRIERQLMGQPVDKVWRCLADQSNYVPDVLRVSSIITRSIGEEIIIDTDRGLVQWRVEGGPGGGRIVIEQSDIENPDEIALPWRDYVENLVARIAEEP